MCKANFTETKGISQRLKGRVLIHGYSEVAEEPFLLSLNSKFKKELKNLFIYLKRERF